MPTTKNHDGSLWQGAFSSYANNFGGKIDLDNYEVAKLMYPHLEWVCRALEAQQMPPGTLEVTPSYVRAYAAFDGTFVQRPFSEDTWRRAVELSAGPRIPFPEKALGSAERSLLEALQRCLFEEERGYQRAVVSASTYFVIRNNWRIMKFDPNTLAVQLKRGFQGSVGNNDNTRQTTLWTSRKVPDYSVYLDPHITEPADFKILYHDRLRLLLPSDLEGPARRYDPATDDDIRRRMVACQLSVPILPAIEAYQTIYYDAKALEEAQ